MGDIYKKLQELNITLPKAPQKGGVYTPAKRFAEKYVYISGCGPMIDEVISGKLGGKFTKEEGVTFARNCMLNILAVLEAEVGDLNKVKDAVKILTFVAGTDDFYDQPFVANGGSALLAELFGEEQVPSRSAIGVNALPGNAPVETEAIFELKQVG